ncbi:MULTISPECIES: hypothetical protein [Cellulosimicrobium]|uniref:hypothetical protein n=1 Tax=Cellulosimicrobium TaxID=157920 RepID=UPI00117867E0|nr:hypothetical protein [Cellulosimicrobium sp. KWT-B]
MSGFSRRVRGLASAVGALLVVGAVAPGAWAEDAPVLTGDEIEVVTPAGMPADEVQEVIEEAFAAEAAGTLIQPRAAVATVSYRWKDHAARNVVIRSDVVTKLRTKHGLTSTSPTRVSTQFPDGNKSIAQGTARVYYATMQKRSCSTIVTCRVTASVRMKTVVEYKIQVPLAEPKGVITSYCEGTTVCPSWVNAVI